MLIALLLAGSTPTFDPIRFFEGATRGEGMLKIVLRAQAPVGVVGEGRVDADGTLTLDQDVAQGKAASKHRTWRLRQTAPGRYEGTLTEARGLVRGEVDGPRLHLRFTSLSGFQVEQWLTLANDGRSAINLLEARRFGLIVAKLTETIRKAD